MKSKYLCMLLLTLNIESIAEPLSLESYDAHYKMSYEKISISSQEDMGLVGLSMLYDFNSYWYGGVGLYGAVDGERGGFFTVGAESGLRYAIAETIQLKSGLFLGAGGGGAAPQGGGLMLRPYLEGDYYTDNFVLGVGVSHVNFPNGDIDSTQLYVSVEVPTSGSYLKGHHFSSDMMSGLSSSLLNADDLETSFFIKRYVPSSGSLNTDGATETSPFTLAGIEVKSFSDNNIYTSFQVAGAGAGESDGYMEVFGGLGYYYQLATLPLYFDFQGALGASGGGRVDTGGGLVYRVQGGLAAKLSDHVILGINGGVIDAFNGNFSATSYSTTIGYTTTIMDHIPSISDGYSVQPIAWSFRMIHKSYLDSDTLFKDPEKNNQLDLLGFAVDYYWDEHFYLTGQTFWAYEGDAGGYAEGIIGVGYHSNTYNGFSFYTEALGGVGGGGGVNVGGGFLGSLGAGIIYDLDDSWEGYFGGAYVGSKDSDFSTSNLTFGVSYKFTLLEKN